MELEPLAGRYTKMENKGFEKEDPRGGCCSPGSDSGGGGGGSEGGGGGISTVEMAEVTKAAAAAVAPPSPAPPLLAVNGNGAITCSEHCQSLHLQHQKFYREKADPPAPESPWHHLKTIFLVGTLIFLALWVLVYTLLSQLQVF